MTRILVIAPHADDEVWGCGGLIRRTVDEGGEVDVVFGAMGGVTYRHLREQPDVAKLAVEARRACDVLGVGRRETLYTGWQQRLDSVPQVELTTALDEILDAGVRVVSLHGREERTYDEVYIPYPSHNQDHQAIHRAAIAALRPGAHPHVRLVAMYEYAYPGWAHLTEAGGRMYVDISDFLEAKLEALACYASQEHDGMHPLSIDSARKLAALRGLEAGVPYAELFHVLHLFRGR